MAKKVNAQRLEARRLFEQDGFSLKAIADELDVKYSTVRQWKSRDKWKKPKKSVTAKGCDKKENLDSVTNKTIILDGATDKRLANLQKHPNFEKGNKAALKHGFYSKFLNPKTNEILEVVEQHSRLENLDESINIHQANYIQAQNKIDYENPLLLNAETNSSRTLANLISDYENLSLINERRRKLELDNELKELELIRERALGENANLTAYHGISIDMVAPVFAKLHHDVQQKKYREFVLPGGRGSTKSSFISLEIFDLIEKNPNMHALVCRQIDKDLRDSVFAQLIWARDMLGLTDEYRFTYKPLEITKKSTGQKIYFTGLSDPTSVKSFTPTFGYVGILWFEELDQVKGNETVRKVEQSVIRGGEDFYEFKSFNPPRSKNNWANLYIHEPKESMHVYFSTYLDVPREWLGEPFIQEAEFLKKVNPEAYKNEYLGEANGSGGNVLPNLVIREITDQEVKTFDDPDQGVDWGWVHPQAFIRAQYFPAQQRIIVFDECGGSYITHEHFAEMLKEHGLSPSDPLPCDTAEPRSINKLQEHGFNAYGVRKFPGSRDYGYKWLASQIEIVVDPKRTPNFYKQAVNLEYERDKEGNLTALIPKIDDDWIDALRYAMDKHMRPKYDPFD